MKTLILFLVLLVLAFFGSVFVASELFAEHGYVMIAFKQTVLETSFATALVTLICLIAALFLCVEFIRRILGAQMGISKWLRKRTLKAARANVSKGLLELARGDYKAAQKLLSQSAKKSDLEMISYLSAAEAANGLNQIESSNSYLSAAEKIEKHDLAIQITKAKLKFERRDWTGCIDALITLRETHANNPEVVKLLYRSYEATNDWQPLIGLLPDIKKHQLLTKADLQTLEKKTFAQGLLQTSAQTAALPNKIMQVEALWERLPKELRADASMAAIYCKQLVMLGIGDKAKVIIESRVKKQWSEELVALYGFENKSDLAERLTQAKAWLKSQPNSAAIYATLGKLYWQSNNLPEAKSQFKSSLELRNSPEVNADLGRLLTEMKDYEASAHHLLAALV